MQCLYPGIRMPRFLVTLSSRCGDGGISATSGKSPRSGARPSAEETMRRTKTAAHAALALAYIADHQTDGAVQARDISAALGASTQSILKVLALLAQAKLVTSKPGRGGGYRLSAD